MDNNQKIFKMHCKTCKKETVGVISKIWNKKGVILCCVECHVESRGWKNFRLLQEHDFEAEENEFNKEKESNNQLNKPIVADLAPREPKKPKNT